MKATHFGNPNLIWLNGAAAPAGYLCCEQAGGFWMRAMDVVTTAVITVGPDTSVQAVAKLLCEGGISGAPVVDAADRLVGIVSEGDLLHRVETGTERPSEHPTGHRPSWWPETIGSAQELTRVAMPKSHGRTAKDFMTRDVVLGRRNDRTRRCGDAA
jgi:hypothetical protein